ncbi:hypothetical protein LINPERHAP1_LOCUS16173 [Linum perenne]
MQVFLYGMEMGRYSMPLRSTSVNVL